MLSYTVIGILAGMVFGIVWVWLGPLNAFFVALFVLAGWLAARLWSGDIDLGEQYDRFLRSRGRRG